MAVASVVIRIKAIRFCYGHRNRPVARRTPLASGHRGFRRSRLPADAVTKGRYTVSAAGEFPERARRFGIHQRRSEDRLESSSGTLFRNDGRIEMQSEGSHIRRSSRALIPSAFEVSDDHTSVVTTLFKLSSAVGTVEAGSIAGFAR